MNRSDVQTWLDRYVDAWRANDRATIEPLFTEDAIYRYRPYLDPAQTVTGSAAIADSWLEEPDEPGTWEASYEPFAVDGDRAVATGVSRYSAAPGKEPRTFHNVFLLRFAPDGRCSDFTELYMREE